MLPWAYLAPMAAQKPVADSTDVFYQHLNLNEVVVRGMTGDAKLKDSSVPISVVSGQQLRSAAATNIIDAVAQQPGVAQVTTGSGISKPVIRGLGYNRVVVVSQGVRQEGQQWGDEHGVEVDAAGVGSAEILKGPASLMYGSDALAGVLLLRDAPLRPVGEMSANVSGEFQSNSGLWGYSANIGGRQQHFFWDLRWSQRAAHAYKNKYDGYVPGTQFAEHALAALLGTTQRWGSSRLRLSAFSLRPGIAEGERDEETGELLCESGDVKTYGKALPFQQVRHLKAVSENQIHLGRGELHATLGYQQNQRQEFEESPDDYSLYFQLHTFTYDARYVLADLGPWTLSAGTGGQWQRSLNKGDEYLIPAYSLFDFGTFLTAQRPSDRWTLSAGLRYDLRRLHSHALTDDGQERFSDFRRTFSSLSGSAGAVWHIDHRTNLRANLARGFRAPNASELGSNGVHEGTLRYEVGNSRLKPENSLQADLGIDFTSKHLALQLALFANRVDNYIYLGRTDERIAPATPTYRFAQGDAQLLGLEASIDVHPLHCLHLENDFSYVYARLLHQPESQRWLPLTPAPRWTSNATYEITHRGRVLNNAFVGLTLDCNFHQGHYYAAEGTETATPFYALLHLTAGTDLMAKGRKVAEVRLTLQNLTDRAYQNHLSRLKYADVNPATGRRGVFNPGRNFVVKVIVPIQIKRAETF